MPYTKNTGMQSLCELFAMKKNMAFQANFDHALTSMKKDYFHRRENFNQEMKKVYNDMMDIRISTGYSLDQVRSAHTRGQFRNPNPPTVYFPPIGVRLVRQYMGVNVKTDETLTPGKATADQSNDDAKSSTLGKSLQSVMAPDAVRSAIRKMSMVNTNIGALANDSKTSKKKTRHVTFGDAKSPTKKKKSVDIIITPVVKNDDLSVNTDTSASLLHNSNVQQTIDDRSVNTDTSASLLHNSNVQQTIDDRFSPITSLQKNNSILSTRKCFSGEDIVADPHDTVDWVENVHEDDTDDMEHVFIETNYNLKERRSSRSTFRTRSSIRLVSQSSLSEHNMEVVNQSEMERGKSGRSAASSKSKAEVGHFYLDYGDGKLHDNMKIPHMKDCARPWCNPHCATCQRRTKQGPCFILIPKKDNDRKRQVPKDKRRLSMFPIYRGNSDLSVSSSTDTINKEVSGTKHEENEPSDSETGSSNDITESTVNKDIDTLLKERIRKRNKGFSKKRIDELAQPRGVPPAEVRFSRTSLRRTREQLKEGERHKAMQLERHNQTILQGKISMFLALLNEHENFKKPPKMVDLPIREDVKLVRKKTDRKKRWKFRFSWKVDPRRTIDQGVKAN